jgi:hypothetical protein
MNAAHLIAALKTTALSEAVRGYPWIWPTCETLHFVGLSLLVGVVGLLDLRLLGFIKRVPLSALRALLPYGIAGFAINLITGALFFIGAPEQYTKNIAFYYKLLFLVVAGVNALYFEWTQGRHLTEIDEGDASPIPFRIAGAVSLLSWFMVLYWGRMLPFVGNAF